MGYTLKDFIHMAVWVLAIGIGLFYMFMPMDIVPDAAGAYGFFDDAIAFILLAMLVKWTVRRFKLGTKKPYFQW